MHQSKIVGSVRTYVHTGTRGLDMRAWFQGLREGRAMVTTGPLVLLTVNGRMPGDEVKLPAAGGDVDVVALGAVHRAAGPGCARVQWRGCREDPGRGDRRSIDFKKRLTGHKERVVSPARRRRARRAVSAGRTLRAGIHQSRLGRRRREAGPEQGLGGVFDQMDRHARVDGTAMARMAVGQGTNARARAVRGGALTLPGNGCGRPKPSLPLVGARPESGKLDFFWHQRSFKRQKSVNG